MARTTSVSLGDHFTAFVDRQVQDGRYSSASDVVHAGLRLLEQHEAKVLALQAALAAGDASGAPTTIDEAAFLAELRTTHAP